MRKACADGTDFAADFFFECFVLSDLFCFFGSSFFTSVACASCDSRDTVLAELSALKENSRLSISHLHSPSLLYSSNESRLHYIVIETISEHTHAKCDNKVYLKIMDVVGSNRGDDFMSPGFIADVA